MSSITGTGASKSTASSVDEEEKGKTGLYTQACDASIAVDALTPNGRLLPPTELRSNLAKLVSIIFVICIFPK